MESTVGEHRWGAPLRALLPRRTVGPWAWQRPPRPADRRDWPNPSPLGPVRLHARQRIRRHLPAQPL
ncbi:MAG: hypothetical protein ACK46L_08025, partial [Synechococcaceae cyanobacterium]